MPGRDDEFKRRVREAGKIPVGGVIIDPKAVKKGPPDPRTDIPFTCTEVTFRQTWHKWIPLLEEDGGQLEMKVVYLEIIDPANQTVYKYGLSPGDLEAELAKIQALIDLRDHKVEIGGEIGGEVVQMREDSDASPE